MMKHDDIFEKFMIEYDKAQMDGSSYPSLTDYERATILDKAYLTLIDQKLTGFNQRGVAFEEDIKAVEDLRPLIKNTRLVPETSVPIDTVSNEYIYKLYGDDSDVLYYLQSRLHTDTEMNSIDNLKHNSSPVILVTHEDANKFKATDYNLPWLKNPVAYVDDVYVHVLIDGYKKNNVLGTRYLYVTYIEKPNKFVDDYDTGESTFELSDSVAEELINLAIVMAGEIVESPRQSARAQRQYDYDNRTNKSSRD